MWGERSGTSAARITIRNNPPQRKYVFCGVELEQVDSFPYLKGAVSREVFYVFVQTMLES